MSTKDNAITLAQYVIARTLEPFLYHGPEGYLEAAIILARVAKELNCTVDLDMAVQKLRRSGGGK